MSACFKVKQPLLFVLLLQLLEEPEATTCMCHAESQTKTLAGQRFRSRFSMSLPSHSGLHSNVCVTYELNHDTTFLPDTPSQCGTQLQRRWMGEPTHLQADGTAHLQQQICQMLPLQLSHVCTHSMLRFQRQLLLTNPQLQKISSVSSYSYNILRGDVSFFADQDLIT